MDSVNLDPSAKTEHDGRTASRTSKVFALSLGQGLTALIGLLSAVVLSRVLEKTEYATFRQTFLAYEFAAPLMGLGIAQAIYYFLPGETHRVRGRVSDALCITVFMGSLFTLFILLGGNQLLAKRFNNPPLAETLLLLVPYPLFMMTLGLLAPVLVVQGRINLLSIFNVLSRMAIGVAVIVPCLFLKEVKFSIIGQIGMTILSASVAVYLMIRATPPGNWKPQLASMIGMVKYSIPLGLATMIGTITLQLDKIIVSSLCEPGDFAIYANGAMEIPLIGIVTGSIAVVILADMRRMVIAGKYDQALALFRRAAEKAAWILLPVGIFLFVSADSFINILYSEKYSDSVLPFRIYLFILPIRIVFYGSLLMAIGKSNVILFRTVASLVINALLSILLVMQLGYIGAAISAMITAYLWGTLFNVTYLSKYFQVSIKQIIPFRKISKIVMISIPPAFLIWCIDIFLHPYTHAIVLFSAQAIIFWSILLFLGKDQIYYNFSNIIDKLRVRN